MGGTESTRPGEDLAEEGGAFVVVRTDERTFVVDMKPGVPLIVGSGALAAVRIASSEVAPVHATLLWDGEVITARNDAGDGLFIGG
jgi:hypothetical protein